MQLDYPLSVDGRGSLARTTEEEHIRDLIEQVLFTSPGERVNRPTFGTGLLKLVFAPTSDELAAATQLAVQAGLHQWLGDRIEFQAVDVMSVESTLTVTVRYIVRRTLQAGVATFSRSL